MDILSGFDLAIELDRLTLFNLVRSHSLMARFRTPFELTIEGTEANGGGTAHFVFVDSNHQMTFAVQPQFGSHPIQYAWRVASDDSGVPGVMGTLRLNITRYIPDPPLGSPLSSAEIEMPYEVSADGTHLTLLAQPEHGNFRVNIVCIATDADGRTSTNYGQALFMTREVVFGGSWREDFAACMRQHARDLYHLGGLDGVLPHDIPRLQAWPPEPAEIVSADVLAALLMRQALAHNDKDIATLHAIMTFGPSLETNLQLPPAISPEVAMQMLRVSSKMLSSTLLPDVDQGTPAVKTGDARPAPDAAIDL